MVVGNGGSTSATLKLGLRELNAASAGGSSSNTKTYVVKSDGILVNGQTGSGTIKWSNGTALDTVFRLVGGTAIMNDRIDELPLLGDAGDFVSFEAVGSTFTFDKGGVEGYFNDASDVTGAFGDSFRVDGALSGNGSLNLTDDGSAWTITAVPEPSSLAFLGLGTLLFARRRRA